MQGGDPLGQTRCSSSISILQLKVKVELETGLEASTLAIYAPELERPLGESLTLVGCGLPCELYAITLCKVDIADLVGVPAGELTDVQLAEACSVDECKGGDIITLRGCTKLSDMSCLGSLKQMVELNIFECFQDIAAATAAAEIIAVRM
jgi:hypothetical protein